MESSQVSRLLEMAIAMSSAQEKATGNGKLDMAGIMAALAMAQKEEMTNNHSLQEVKDGGQNSFLHGSYQKTTFEKTSISSFVREEFVSKTVSDERKTNETEPQQIFLQETNTRNKFAESKYVKEKEKENDGSSLTGMHISSTRSSDDHIQGETHRQGGHEKHKINRQDFIKESDSNIENMVNSTCSDIKTDILGRKVAGHEEAIENISTSFESSSSSSLSSSSCGNSSPSFQKTSVKKANLQNNPPSAFLPASHGNASLMTKTEHHNMENNASGEIVANDEMHDKNTTNTTNQPDNNGEETNGITGIRNIKALFERKTADEMEEETGLKENKLKTIDSYSYKNNAVNKMPKHTANKAAIESMNSKITSSLSSSSPLSSSVFDNSLSSKSNKNSSVVKNLHNNTQAPFLASSLTMTKSHNMENNAFKEKVTNDGMCEANKRSFLHKITTNKLKNQMEGKQEQTNGLTGIKNIKAMFEKRATDDEKKKTVHKENKLNTPEHNSYTNNAMINKSLDLETSLADLLDSSDLQVSHFLAKVSELSAEKEKKTGNGKLDMVELAAALSSVTEQSDQLYDKGLAKYVMNNLSSSLNPQSHKKDQTLVSPSSSPSSLSPENKKTIKIEDEQQIIKSQSSFSHSETVTSSSNKTQFSTKKSSFDSTPSNLANAKTSFLQSIISQSPTNEQLSDSLPTSARKDTKYSSAFIPEKNSVMSELKNIINDEPTPVSTQPKRSFNSIPKGFQAPDLSGQNLNEVSHQIPSKDPMVKKIVYNQYRDMLKSYTNCN